MIEINGFWLLLFLLQILNFFWTISIAAEVSTLQQMMLDFKRSK